MRWWWGSLFLDQHAEVDFYSASSLKQQSAGRHVAPLWHIILIPSQPVFALSLSRAATNTNFIVFGLTWRDLEPTIYRTRGEHANHYATIMVPGKIQDLLLLLYITNKIWHKLCLQNSVCILKKFGKIGFEAKRNIW